MNLYGVILQLHIEIEQSNKPVSRTIYIHSKATLQNLHETIQILYDWWDRYPSQFLHKLDRTIALKDVKKNKESKIEGRSVLSKDSTLEKVFHHKDDQIFYEYGYRMCWTVRISLKDMKEPASLQETYPHCIAAENELNNEEYHGTEAVNIRFSNQETSNQDTLVNRLNKKLQDHILQRSIADISLNQKESWHELHQLTARYYKEKPWEWISNEQIFVLYNKDFDEYLFCTVLGQKNDFIGLSVYRGFTGLVSLHSSLTKSLSIEQLFQLHKNLLLQFQKMPELPAKEFNSASSYLDEVGVYAQFTSYKPGYYPWKLSGKEVSLFSFALRRTLELFEKVKLGYDIPHYINEDRILLLTSEKNDAAVKETYLSFNQMVQKVVPIQVTVSSQDLAYLKGITQNDALTIEFSLQYVDVPIQRLKNNRPFLPLSSVIADRDTKQILYHNIYNTRLNYEIVQTEFVQMIRLLKQVPGKILTDPLTYHYLKPLLSLEQFPVTIDDKLTIVEEVNKNVLHYLLSKAE